MAEAGGFEPPVTCATPVFKTASTRAAGARQGRFLALFHGVSVLVSVVACGKLHRKAILQLRPR
jgi:hypothetical protein